MKWKGPEWDKFDFQPIFICYYIIIYMLYLFFLIGDAVLKTQGSAAWCYCQMSMIDYRLYESWLVWNSIEKEELVDNYLTKLDWNNSNNNNNNFKNSTKETNNADDSFSRLCVYI